MTRTMLPVKCSIPQLLMFHVYYFLSSLFSKIDSIEDGKFHWADKHPSNFHELIKRNEATNRNGRSFHCEVKLVNHEI